MLVGLKIKEFLREIGVSQTHISKVTGIGICKLNLALNGKRKLTFEEYQLICGALNVRIDKFLEPRKLEA